MRKTTILKNMSFPYALALLFPFLAGLFHEAYAAAAALILLGWIVYCRIRNGRIVIRGSLTLWTTAALAGSYLISSFWAVDSGLAVLGAVKFLTLPLFVIACEQTVKKTSQAEQTQSFLMLLPYSAALMTVLSLLLSLIPSLHLLFYSGIRLAGFFEYPNTFALYLLLGIPCLLVAGKWSAKEIICALILFIGILLSGSRAVLLLMAGMILIYCFRIKNKVTRVILPSVFGTVIIAAIAYALLSNSRAAFDRILTRFSQSETIISRLMCYLDSLPLILRHPFGLGYMGYYFLQGSIQSGVYSAQHVHNEFLQLLLDVGWIPAVAMAAAIIRSFFKADFTKRMIIFLLIAHSMVDFDLQFAAMGVILVIMLDRTGKKEFVIKGITVYAAAPIIAAFCLYFGIAAGLYQTHHNTAAAKWYSGYTFAQLNLLTQESEARSMEERADIILSYNQSSSLAWSAKARVAFAKGDYPHMIEYKKKAITLAKYTLQEYLDYADMLWQAKTQYEQQGNKTSAGICQAELHNIPLWIQETRDNTSSLGWRSYARPKLDIPPEYAWLKEQ